MKLLGWMHRKFRQNSTEQFKDLVIGQPSLDDEQNYHKTNLGNKLFKQTQKGQNLRKSFAGLEATRVDEDYDGEPPASICDLFPGFLAIGTLGSEQVISDPSTPTFAISVEGITEKEDEVTENDLKLINDELEKVLGAETKDDISNDSSSRNSHVSTGRSSHCKSEKEDKRTEREADKSAMNLMKGKLKKRMFHTCSRNSTSISGGGPIDSASAETKLNKILHMFRKKVHPESSTAAQKSARHRKNENKKKIINDGGLIKGDLVHPDPEEDSSANREHWIKTDADYLVLEL
ncbi:hypothetical protein SESBI_05002 [Sesbania bispinosa]|nr:hypothetical protein SESBI_05002 [Sesbania bispinosa]